MQRYKEENTIILCKKKGELTIFLALLLTIVIGFLVVLIESVRVQGIRLYIEEVFDMGLHSCLGEYEQELFKRYDLLFVDTSYRGAEKGNIDNLKKHLAEYIEENMENSGNKGNWYKEELKQKFTKITQILKEKLLVSLLVEQLSKLTSR